MTNKSFGNSLADAALAVASLAPPAFAVLELSAATLKFRSPRYAEVSAAWRYRWPLWGAGLAGCTALLWRSAQRRSSAGLAYGTAATLAGLAASVPLLHAPTLFGPRRTKLRLLSGDEASNAFEAEDTEVLGVYRNNEARAYPVRKAARPHMIVDSLGGETVVLSYCGLTNSALAYIAEENGPPELTVLAAPGNNVLYWNARSESLIQQLLPDAPYGATASQRLRTLPVYYTTWAAWRRLAPETTLGDVPYDSLRDRAVTSLMRFGHKHTRKSESPFMAVAGGIDKTVHPKAQVFALLEAGEARA